MDLNFSNAAAKAIPSSSSKLRSPMEIVTPKGRFKTPLAALRRMLKDSNGQKVKATTHEERLAIRVAEITNGSHKFETDSRGN